MLRMAIDLLWVRHRKLGGTESYARNLLDSFRKLEDKFEFYLLVSEDNADSFLMYDSEERYKIIRCNVRSANVYKRVIWQNIHLADKLRELNVSLCFEPIYGKPIHGGKNIKYITTIHDLQELHFPEYFPKIRIPYMKMCWKNAVNSSSKIVAISEYVKNDLIKRFNADREKIKVIYNPVIINKDESLNFDRIKEKYHVNKGEFYFTVASLLPHKNIKTLIKVFKKIKDENRNIPCQLIVSGTGGKRKAELLELIHNEGLDENIILTPFIDNAERNALYKNCRTFLFPSIFEGFGMPPIEAMYYGVPVITTRKASLYEVTKGEVNYVDDPFSIDEWIDKMAGPLKCEKKEFEEYRAEHIARQYYNLFLEINKA